MISYSLEATLDKKQKSHIVPMFLLMAVMLPMSVPEASLSSLLSHACQRPPGAPEVLLYSHGGNDKGLLSWGSPGKGLCRKSQFCCRIFGLETTRKHRLSHLLPTLQPFSNVTFT